MSDITIKTYTTPCKSRSGNYSDGTTVVQSSGSVSYIGSGGSSVDIVKELGTDTLSDANVFSSLRTIKEITDRGHTHANKSALDNLTQTVIDNSHTHSNKAIIDGITSALVSDWNNAVHKSGDEDISGHKQFTEGVGANAGLGVTGGANIDETNTGLLKLQDTDDNGTSYESEITDSEGVLEIKSQRYRFYDDTKTKYIDVLVDADGNYRINGNLYVLGGLTIEGNGIASVATQYSFAVNSNNELVLTIDD